MSLSDSIYSYDISLQKHVYFSEFHYSHKDKIKTNSRAMFCSSFFKKYSVISISRVILCFVSCFLFCPLTRTYNTSLSERKEGKKKPIHITWSAVLFYVRIAFLCRFITFIITLHAYTNIFFYLHETFVSSFAQRQMN